MSSDSAEGMPLIFMVMVKATESLFSVFSLARRTVSAAFAGVAAELQAEERMARAARAARARAGSKDFDRDMIRLPAFPEARSGDGYFTAMFEPWGEPGHPGRRDSGVNARLFSVRHAGMGYTGGMPKLGFIGRVLGDSNEKELKRLSKIVDEINDYADETAA